MGKCNLKKKEFRFLKKKLINKVGKCWKKKLKLFKNEHFFKYSILVILNTSYLPQWISQTSIHIHSPPLFPPTQFFLTCSKRTRSTEGHSLTQFKVNKVFVQNNDWDL